MPQVQVIDTTPTKQEPTAFERTFGGFLEANNQNKERDALEDIYKPFQEDDNIISQAIYKTQTDARLSPTARVEQMNNLLNLKKINNQQAKLSNNNLTPEEFDERIDNLVDQGFSNEEAKEYLLSTPGVQVSMDKRIADEVARGIRKKPISKADQSTQIPDSNTALQQPAEQPLDGPIGSENALSTEGKEIEDVWPDLPEPKETTPAERVKWRNQNQKENNKALSETRTKTNSTTGIGLRLNLLGQLSEKISDDTASRLIINPATGEPYTLAQITKLGVPPEVQQYVKTLNDFLIDAKAYFGNRVTNFDIQSFKSRLPSLLNSASGRRVIIKQMQLMNDLQHIHGKTLEDGLKHYGRNASYSDIVAVTDEKVAAQEQEIIQKINSLVTAGEFMETMANNPEDFKDKIMMQTEDGEFMAVKKSRLNDALKMKWKVY